MIRTQEVRKEQNNFFKKHENPRPLNFFIEFKYRRKSSGYHDYKQQLDKALQDDPNSKKLLDLRRKYDNNYKNDWAQYEDWKKNKKVNEAVKKRKREAHARFHAQLDDNLDGGNFFDSQKSVS
ncbi:5771_t:CDS:2 [Paraglomus occultum]|uniref:5771_t:CDS:1 n=1 Tax=Paraglomus occultum TaxID=144539 RepID=A0A9N8VVT2_9GLOM|nr:5771_t:CDS:2 [Paraglomus occultum]